MKIIRAIEFGNSTNAAMEISTIFVEGFYQWLHFFSKDKDKLIRAFAHMFQLDTFYAAVIDGELAGITACTDGKQPVVVLKKEELRKHLGIIMGSVTYYVLRREFELKKYPFAIKKEMGMIEFVATSPRHRGQGIASAVIGHIIASTPYLEYALEVADTNINAVKLYEKLGFREFMRVKQKNSKQSGINHLVYMKYEKTKENAAENISR